MSRCSNEPTMAATHQYNPQLNWSWNAYSNWWAMGWFQKQVLLDHTEHLVSMSVERTVLSHLHPEKSAELSMSVQTNVLSHLHPEMSVELPAWIWQNGIYSFKSGSYWSLYSHMLLLPMLYSRYLAFFGQKDQTDRLLRVDLCFFLF